MDFIFSLSMHVRLPVVFALGACLGAAINLAVYQLAWYPRSISPWSRPDPKAPRRRAWDRLPIIGWLGLRRESGLHGSGFWLRPMCVELLAGVGFAWLYWWEVGVAGLFPADIPRPEIGLHSGLVAVLHVQFAVHVLLIALMLAASLIDVDEKIIPDTITVPGTLLGLLLAAAWPMSLLPDVFFLRLTSPNPWVDCLNGFPREGSLWLGLGCWWLWALALLPRTWYSRHGWRRAIALCWARVARETSTYRIFRMALMGSLAIAFVWYRGRDGWEALLSALVGMAASGGLVWLVRIIGAVTLRREAMGFGDVTLMAMLGAFLGWQPCLLIFFLAPFAALAVGVLRLILFRDKEIPYGPFLCMAALLVIVRWQAIWSYVLPTFLLLGGAVPLFVLGCLMMMAVMLGVWGLIRRAFL